MEEEAEGQEPEVVHDSKKMVSSGCNRTDVQTKHRHGVAHTGPRQVQAIGDPSVEGKKWPWCPTLNQEAICRWCLLGKGESVSSKECLWRYQTHSRAGHLCPSKTKSMFVFFFLFYLLWPFYVFCLIGFFVGFDFSSLFCLFFKRGRM